MVRKYTSKVVYYASYNSRTHIGTSFTLAKLMPEVLFYVVTAELWPFGDLDNVIVKQIRRPNCSIRLDSKIYLHTYDYEKDLPSPVSYREHIQDYLEILKDVDPNLVIVDITYEVAIWSKLLGYPTCVFYETIDNSALRIKIAWDSVDSVLVRYPERFVKKVEGKLHSNMVFLGGTSRFDLGEKVLTIPSVKDSQETVVTFVSSSNAHDNSMRNEYFQPIVAALARLKNSKVNFFYPKNDDFIIKQQEKYRHINFIIGDFDQIERFIAKSDIIVSPAGMGIVMETSLYQKPMLLIPALWIYQEQMNKAKILHEIGACRYLDPKEMTENTVEDAICEILNDDAVRRKMKAAQKELIDGRGYYRLREKITELLASDKCMNKISIEEKK
ncbi:MAG: glycosyltransferase [Candidatus Berkelbacteria bacterium]